MGDIRLPPPIISVGNLAMGGRGKTPTVAHLARLLVSSGERPAILSRGYKRRRPEDGVVIVADGTNLCADLDRSGDEPLMLARTVPGAAVLVCETRAVAAALADTLLGATVLILDDGFQHRMRRDVDVVLVTPHDLADRRLPFGRLRSPVSALRRADAVVLDVGEVAGSVDRSAWLTAMLKPGAAVFTLRRRLGSPYWLHDGAAAEPCPAVALAAIARPGRFTRALAAAGWIVRESVSFRDHHRFTHKDLASVRRTMEATGASSVVTTEKDAVRLRPLRPLDLPVMVAPLGVSVEPDDRFRAWIASRLDEARR